MITKILDKHNVMYSASTNTMDVYEYELPRRGRRTFTVYYSAWREHGRTHWDKYVTIYGVDEPITVELFRIKAAFDVDDTEEVLEYLGEFLVTGKTSITWFEDEDKNSERNVKARKSIVERLANLNIKYRG